MGGDVEIIHRCNFKSLLVFVAAVIISNELYMELKKHVLKENTFVLCKQLVFCFRVRVCYVFTGCSICLMGL